MHEQVSPLVLDHEGRAQRGVLIRHLVVPGGLAETRQILDWIAREPGAETYVNGGRMLLAGDAFQSGNRRTARIRT